MDFLKAEQLSNSKWRVLAIPFGGPFKGKDLDGEFFSPRTDIKADWFNERPVLWQHAKDMAMGDDVLGTQDDLEQERDGWWGKVWLDRSNRYWKQVDKLLSQGRVYGSSGALSHLVRMGKDGEVLIWPHIEQSLTTTPSNPFSRVIAAKAVDNFESAGIPVDPNIFDPDLGRDLPSGGDDSAMARLSSALDELDGLIRSSREAR